MAFWCLNGFAIPLHWDQVDDRYSQCLDEIHTIISAFHAATELDPQVHASFALQTISFLYKNLRERISNQILAMGANFDGGCTRGREKSFQNSFIQEQWALQQLKKKDQLWRPQRGLHEKYVSVLRAWMFQNFLHPWASYWRIASTFVRSWHFLSQLGKKYFAYFTFMQKMDTVLHILTDFVFAGTLRMPRSIYLQ